MKKGKYIYHSIFLILGGFLSCSEMDESMMKFMNDGELNVYAPKVNPDSVEAFAGRDRLKLSFKGLNPKVTNVKISWNNNAQSITAPVEGMSPGDDFEVFLSEMDEGAYTFDMVTYDNFENSSIKATVSGNVYGDIYAGTLKPRVIKDVIFNDVGNVEVIWSGANNGTIGTVLKYMDVDGVQQEIFDAIRDTTEIPGFKVNEDLTYQTVFLPEPTAIDTFYSNDAIRYVEGPRIDISKTGWTATASSFDGRSCCRGPAYAIDENITTEWVNSIVPQAVFPHTITIDMGQEHPLRGFSFVQRQNTTASLLKDFQILVSTDSVAWNSMGDYVLSTVKSKQYIDIPEIVNARYIRVICKSANDGGKNLGLPEAGAFTR